MKDTMTCERCGAPMLAGSPSRGLQDLCPRCVMGFALEEATPAPAAPAALKPGTTLGAYEIVGVLGRGGMGVVYRARHTTLDRDVALKVLAAAHASDPDFMARFRREAKALAALNHPNIVAVYDFGVAGDLPYIAMEHVDGVSLRRLIAERRLPPEEALRIVPQLCDALEYAHEAGVVHRDIKPENILVDRSGRVKIADFGIAKLVDAPVDALTQTHALVGTPAYMAPEQFNDPRRVDHRADIYSMGVVLYEMLTGEIPRGRFAPPSRKAPVDGRLDQIVLRALEEQPDQRYQRARDVKEDVTTLGRVPASRGAEVRVRAEFGTADPTGARWCVTAILGFVLTVLGMFAALSLMVLDRPGRVGVQWGCLVLALLVGGGAVCSLVGTIMVASSRGRLRGAGFGIAGLLLSALWVVVVPVMLFWSSAAPARIPDPMPADVRPMSSTADTAVAVPSEQRMESVERFTLAESWPTVFAPSVVVDAGEERPEDGPGRARILERLGRDGEEHARYTDVRWRTLYAGGVVIAGVERAGGGMDPWLSPRGSQYVRGFTSDRGILLITSMTPSRNGDAARVAAQIRHQLARGLPGDEPWDSLRREWPDLPSGFRWDERVKKAETTADIEQLLREIGLDPARAADLRRAWFGTINGGDFDLLGWEALPEGDAQGLDTREGGRGNSLHKRGRTHLQLRRLSAREFDSFQNLIQGMRDWRAAHDR